MQADFSHGPQALPEFVKRLESGADLVVGEATTLSGVPSTSRRLARRWASRLLRRGVKVPGVADLVSGFVAIRLIVLRHLLKGPGARPLTTDGWAANAELVARAAGYARRIETLPIEERYDLRSRPTRVAPGPPCGMPGTPGAGSGSQRGRYPDDARDSVRRYPGGHDRGSHPGALRGGGAVRVRSQVGCAQCRATPVSR